MMMMIAFHANDRDCVTMLHKNFDSLNGQYHELYSFLPSPFLIFHFPYSLPSIPFLLITAVSGIYTAYRRHDRGERLSRLSNRSIGHRSSSESNRNERGYDLRGWPWSPGITLLECQTSRPIFTVAFMTAQPCKRHVFRLKVNGCCGCLFLANAFNYYFYF